MNNITLSIVSGSLSLLLFLLSYIVKDIPIEIAIPASLVTGILFFAAIWYALKKRANHKASPATISQDAKALLQNTKVEGSTLLQGNILKDCTITINAEQIHRPPLYDQNNARYKMPRSSGSSEYRPSETAAPASPELSDGADKESTSRQIREALEYLHNRHFQQARILFYEILADIKNKPGYSRERARVYNNLGVSYNQPDEHGDLEQAKKLFLQALNEDPSFYQAKLNLGLAYVGEGTSESIARGWEIIWAVWQSLDRKLELPDQDLEALMGATVWSTYRHKGAEEGVRLVHGFHGRLAEFASHSLPVLRLTASMQAEIGDIGNALQTCDSALTYAPNDPELLTIKARTILIDTIKDERVIQDGELVPEVKDKTSVEMAFELFRKAEQASIEQNKDYLFPEIHLGIIQCQLLLGKYEEAPAILKQIDVSKLPLPLHQHLNVLTFTTHLQNRSYEAALRTLKESPNYEQISYNEKKHLAKQFTHRGAPEQARELLAGIEKKADELKDFDYWLDIALINMFLDRKQDAVSAANKARRYANVSDLSPTIRKQFLSNYSALLFRYSVSVGKDEGNRLLPALLEFQKEFPGEKILIPIKALDDDGKPTDEIKTLLTDTERARIQLRDSFKANPVPTYVLAKQTKTPYPDFICKRHDPDFTIEFTVPEQSFVLRLIGLFKKSDKFILDYLILLDLSHSDMLGFLERTEKTIQIHESLFQAIQNDLIMLEIPELRQLWDFLRRSKSIEFVTDIPNVSFDFGDISPFLDTWLVNTMKFAKANQVPLATDDLRLLRFLESEKIHGLNIYAFIDYWLRSGDLDKKAYSHVLGRLAERAYIFLSFDQEDLAAIASQDDYKITLRSYHLVNQLLLPGSEPRSFLIVFARFIKLIWGAGILTDDKLKWLEFLTRKILDKVYCGLPDDAEIDLDPFAKGLVLIWKNAITVGTKDDLTKLLPRVHEIIDKKQLKGIGDKFKEMITKRLE